MSTKTIPLSALEGELRRIKFSEDLTLDALSFVCPICLDVNGGKRPGVHLHLVPFVTGEPAARTIHPVTHVWGHAGGTNVETITLTPSYLAKSSSTCVLHCFIRNGQVEILGDSKKLAD